MSKILFAVHRAAPYPGGSEYYVQDMAEELKNRGHETWILAHTIKESIHHGVHITNDYEVLNQPWDLIIVHGGDVITQDVVHTNSDKIKSPILYMIIKPSESENCLFGMKHSTFLGYSTSFDIDHIEKHGHLAKGRRIRHGVNPATTIVAKGQFKPSQIQTKHLFVSAGGYYPNKAMVPLADTFSKLNLPDVTLALFGYGEGPVPEETKNIKVYKNVPRSVVMSAIADADCYILNSTEEGFGLVLLEAMLNKTYWIARDIAGAHDLFHKGLGQVYRDENDLGQLMRHYSEYLKYVEEEKIKMSLERPDLLDGYMYTMGNHTIIQTANDIEDVLMELGKNGSR